MKTYTGTAQDIGCEIFIEHIMPIIRKASHGMEPKHLAELYAGFFAGACGSMAADFGKEAAKIMIDSVAEQFDDVVQGVDMGMVQ